MSTRARKQKQTKMIYLLLFYMHDQLNKEVVKTEGCCLLEVTTRARDVEQPEFNQGSITDAVTEYIKTGKQPTTCSNTRTYYITTYSTITSTYALAHMKLDKFSWDFSV